MKPGMKKAAGQPFPQHQTGASSLCCQCLAYTISLSVIPSLLVGTDIILAAAGSAGTPPAVAHAGN
jgi:hypothetical protein